MFDQWPVALMLHSVQWLSSINVCLALKPSWTLLFLALLVVFSLTIKLCILNYFLISLVTCVFIGGDGVVWRVLQSIFQTPAMCLFSLIKKSFRLHPNTFSKILLNQFFSYTSLKSLCNQFPKIINLFTDISLSAWFHYQ